MSARSIARIASVIATAAGVLAVSLSAAISADRNDRFDAGGATPTQLSRLLQPMPLAASTQAATTRSLAGWRIAGLRMTTLEATARSAAARDVTGSIGAPTVREAPTAISSRPELLASVAISFRRLPALQRIAPVYAEIETDFLDKCSTIMCDNATATLKQVLAHRGEDRLLDLVAAVNRSVNRLISYRRDRDLYGTADFWAKPSATLNKGMGDCEDYAILKMAVLAKAGVPASSMSVVILRDEKRKVYHAVTAVQTDRGAYILDNLEADIRKDSELPNYMPLYSVSAGRGYIYGRRTGGAAMVASAGRLDSIAPGEGLDPEIVAQAVTAGPR